MTHVSAETLLNPDMTLQELRLHMGELIILEVRSARAAIQWANSKAEPIIATLTAERDSALAEVGRMREAGTALVAKMDAIRPQLDAMFMHAKVHGFKYTAPGYGVDLNALRAALQEKV